ncbi:hypothetical protein L210DRAFT_3507663 [Boletus edulis BED1]|uniref:Uncharacterized protein n=1 Tax=Boletus edulis BED1 TaxID=1328754 RepID=A0AAD4G967_BOLED|nr:hypothetical protein L210DRAFT_3507663 [Boletus edulis BED1]
MAGRDDVTVQVNKNTFSLTCCHGSLGFQPLTSTVVIEYPDSLVKDKLLPEVYVLYDVLSLTVADFIPGGSFGRPTIGPYNSSGTLTTRPKDLVIDTLQNISPDDRAGFERWDLLNAGTF